MFTLASVNHDNFCSCLPFLTNALTPADLKLGSLELPYQKVLKVGLNSVLHVYSSSVKRLFISHIFERSFYYYYK